MPELFKILKGKAFSEKYYNIIQETYHLRYETKENNCKVKELVGLKLQTNTEQ